MRVTESMGPAWETMKRLLFRPFNIGTWFSFGFIFFLQSCVEGGGSNGLNIPRGNSGGGGSGGSGGGDTGNRIDAVAHDIAHSLAQFGSGLSSGNAPGADFDTSLIIIIAAVGIVIAIPIIILTYWLGTRGQMMSIRAVATGNGSIGEQWSATREAAGMLFKFHLAFAGFSCLVFLPLIGVGGVMLLPVYKDGAAIESMLPMLIGLGVLILVLIFPFMLVGAMARNFVAPIMLKHDIGAREGWRRFWAVGRNHIGAIFGFYVMRVLVGMLAGVVGIFAGLLTCCLGLLPILHQTVMAPYYVFERAWTLEVLASMSSDFDLRSGVAAAPVDPYGGGGGGGGGAYNPYAGAPAENPYAPPGYGGGGYNNPPPGGFGGT